MTRGIFFHLMALILCLPPPAATLQTKENAAAPPAIAWHAAGAITFPFEYFRQHIYVTVSLNGKPGFIFMLDSGANRNVLNLRTAERLGIKPRRLGQASGIGFGVGRVYVGPEENIDAEINAVPIASKMTVIDLNQFEQHFNHTTDGMLGYPFFRRFVVKLDFQRKELTLLPPDKYRYRGLGVQVPLLPSKNFVEASVTAGSSRYVQHSIDVVLDTGSNVTLILYERFLRPLGLGNSFHHGEPVRAYGLNGYYYVERGTVYSLQIGNAETHNLPAAYLEDEAQVGPERDLPGAIGNGILQSFRTIIFDVPQQQAIFEVNPPPWQSGLVRSATNP